MSHEDKIHSVLIIVLGRQVYEKKLLYQD